ncbi:MAG: YgiT-type zinc finger protein, partial [Anaerolineaceae bacterium]|nr:YgiT-type zinc finger protein [Anaerolineaceae bacterium]
IYTMTTPLNIISQPCMNCQAGQKCLRLVTFITWLGDEMITVPDFPAWVCDMCGHRNYDSRALAQLSLVLNPDAGQPINRKYSPPPSLPPQGAPPIG